MGLHAPVLDRRRGLGGAGRLRALSVRRPARHRRAREPAPALRGDRRGPRHACPTGCASAWRGRRAVVSRAVLRARRRDGFTAPARASRARRWWSPPTHDLPTLAGWWQGARSSTLRTQLGLRPARDRARAQQARAHDRARLLRALQRERLLPPEVDRCTLAAHAPMTRRAGARACIAIWRAARRSSLVVQLEDVLAAADQANLPGTTDSTRTGGASCR